MLGSREGLSFVTRRSFLFVGASLMVAQARPVRAQVPGSMKEVLSQAASVRQIAIDMPLEGIEDQLIPFITADYEARRATLRAARETGLFGNVASANNFVAELASIDPVEFNEDTLASIREVNEFILSEGIELVPPPNDVTPEHIPSLPPPPDKTPDSDMIVLMDIVLETLGISDVTLSVTLIKGDPEIERFVSETLAAVTKKDWPTVVSRGETLIRYVVTNKRVRAILLQILGKKLAFRLALRCVPVLGWLYTGALFVVSVKKNYHRFSFS